MKYETPKIERTLDVEAKLGGRRRYRVRSRNRTRRFVVSGS